MKDRISIKTSRRRIFWAVIFAIAVEFYVYVIGQNFDVSDIQNRFLTYEIIVAAVAIAFKTNLANRDRLYYNLALLIVISVMMTLCLDLLNGMYVNPSEEGPKPALERFLISAAFCYFLYLFFIAVTGRTKTAVVAGTGIIFAFGVVAYVILELRGSRLLFADFSAVGTALNIASGYTKIPVFAPLYLGLASLFCIIPVVNRILPNRYMQNSKTRLGFFMIFLYGFFGIYMTNFEELNYSWTEVQNSYLFSFFANAKLLNIRAPKDYKAAQAEDTIKGAKPSYAFLSSTYNANKEIKKYFPDYVKENGTVHPNIIVIMNESLADLEVYGDIDTEEEIMPFINHLSNTLQGDVFTEVRGGGTADSEYTFLTGNSTLLLPTSARPYQLYVNENSTNIVSELDNLGYQTIAIHPGYPGSWNRDKVYQYFKFQEFYSSEAFQGAMYRRNPNLYADIATYQKIIELYENKGVSPLFIFDVTLQNHGSYAQGYENLKKLQVYSDLPDDVVEYLSLVHASDEDFSELVNYFKEQDEPTLIVMFGDHQPNFTSNFFEQVLGKDDEDYTLKESQRIQATPYVIWANYPLPDNTVGSVSINYLSTLMWECAGLEPNKYNTYLANLHTRLKIVNRKGIITENEEYYGLDDPNLPDKYKKYINDYKNVLYYNMFDQENLDNSLFENSG